MTEEAQTILDMIENLQQESRNDVGAERKLNKAVALYLGWYYYPPAKAREKFKGSWRRGAWVHPSDVSNGKPVFCQMHGTDVHSDIPNFVNSRDALKTIRPEKYKAQMITSLCSPLVHFVLDGHKKIFRSNWLPTEELAELHCIVQAIAWERNAETPQKGE